MKKKTIPPNRIRYYFHTERKTLFIVSTAGLLYNVSLLSCPWFEGQLAQCLLDIFAGRKFFADMLNLVMIYIAAILLVQVTRYLKRYYVSRFCNNIDLSMKHILYGNLIHQGKAELEQENTGTLLTKAIADVDACADGMKKVVTELFDTGVVLVGYACMLFVYDWRLALLSMIFSPLSYILAEKMKGVVQRSNAAYKESAGRLNTATLDRTSNAVTYRVFGCEPFRDADYENHLADYEKTSVRANIWGTVMPPLYQTIALISLLLIVYFGSRNVLQEGWVSWNIAAFTTFLACFTKLAVRSASVAKLLNAVQKADVSWKRIQPLLKPVVEDTPAVKAQPLPLTVQNLTFTWPGLAPCFQNLSFSAKPGQIIGVTGPVACGKSTLGRVFLCEHPYEGQIFYGSQELSGLSDEIRCGILSYQGHDPELLSDSIRNNVLLGRDEDVLPYLKAVCLDEEIARMPEGADTVIGSGGVRLSGGQQARLALARTLAHPTPLIILDDPFAALDRQTEQKVFANLQERIPNSILILISHRLYLFPHTSQVLWMENGQTTVSTHEELMKNNPQYANLYHTQQGGTTHEAH